MSGMFDLFGDADLAPAVAPRRQPAPAKHQPAAPVCPPNEPACKPVAPALASSTWAYIHPATTPAGLIAFVCMCGAREDRPAPALDNVTCWRCHEPEGMRPRPWRPAAADLARPFRI
ncbi:hypothetical protein [Sphingomonas solaris]|uniref:hypothetical protein n=1 Tax=Alterirhizorhabdus solaris TaxID=2529389 RepID=UPI001396B0B2|nr:hypothetical protein [Sphingomonas solaris]